MSLLQKGLNLCNYHISCRCEALLFLAEAVSSSHGIASSGRAPSSQRQKKKWRHYLRKWKFEVELPAGATFCPVPLCVRERHPKLDIFSISTLHLKVWLEEEKVFISRTLLESRTSRDKRLKKVHIRFVIHMVVKTSAQSYLICYICCAKISNGARYDTRKLCIL